MKFSLKPTKGRRLVLYYILYMLIFFISGCDFQNQPIAARALCVGLNYYAPNINSLSWCVADATAMAAALSQSGYDSDTLLAEYSNSAITKPLFLDTLSDIAAEAPLKGYDIFVFCYSGHGSDLDNGYLIMSNADSIGFEELNQAVTAIPARSRLLILDSCYSGLFVPEGSAIAPFPGDYTGTALSASLGFPRFLLAQVSAYSSYASNDLLVMSAAGSRELSWEITHSENTDQPSGHGIFTAGLLESRYWGDKNNDGLISISEAYYYALEFVKTYWNDLPSDQNSLYRPRISTSNLDTILFRLAETVPAAGVW